MKTISLKTNSTHEYLDITAHVQRAVEEAGVASGICVVFCSHTTAGITINENADPDVMRDITRHMDEMVPDASYFTHAEGNSSGHIKSSLFGPSLTVIVDKGKLVLGTWQGIYFCEFDGPRTRTVQVKAIKG